MSTVGVLFAVGAALALTCQAIFIRLATRRSRTNDVVLAVISLNVIALIPLTLLFVPSPTVTLRTVVVFAVTGVVGTVLGRAFFYAGIKRVGASRAEPMKATIPLHATVLAVLFLGETVSRLQSVGILLIVAGIAIITREGSASDRAAGRDVPWLGLVLPLFAAFLYGVEPIFASVGLRDGTEVLVGLSIKSVTALLVMVLYLAVRRSLPGLGDLATDDGRWIVLAGVANTAFLLFYYAGLAVSNVSVVVPIMQTSPVLVLAASALFLRRIETVTPRLVAAAGIIVAGSVTVTVYG